MKSIMICQAKASAHRAQSRKANGFVTLFAKALGFKSMEEYNQNLIGNGDDVMKTHTINKNGMQQIVDQLKAKCKADVFDGWLDNDLIDSRESQEMLAAWAHDLETVLDDENGDEIEISEHQTISGHTEFLSVTTEGIDIEFNQEVV
jgi:hypothetical protein